MKHNTNEQDVKAWEAWLLGDMSDDVLSVDIRVEGALHNHSTVLLITVPIEVWIIISDLPGYK